MVELNPSLPSYTYAKVKKSKKIRACRSVTCIRDAKFDPVARYSHSIVERYRTEVWVKDELKKKRMKVNSGFYRLTFGRVKTNVYANR